MAYHEMKTMTKKTWDPGLLSRSDKNGTASSPKNPVQTVIKRSDSGKHPSLIALPSSNLNELKIAIFLI